MAAKSDKTELQRQLALAADGDEGAWQYLVDSYAHRVFALIRAKCNNEELAEEIAQSTFCTVAAKIGEYTELGKFEAWLFRIAVNRLRDEMRRRARQARPMEHETLGALAGGVTDDHGEEADRLAELQQLREAMTELADADQQILHLRHAAGLTFKQIAEVLDEPLGTVLARQHRALAKLRRILDPDGADESDLEEEAIDGPHGR